MNTQAKTNGLILDAKILMEIQRGVNEYKLLEESIGMSYKCIHKHTLKLIKRGDVSVTPAKEFHRKPQSVLRFERDSLKLIDTYGNMEIQQHHPVYAHPWAVLYFGKAWMGVR